jgi:hypothetical protein
MIKFKHIVHIISSLAAGSLIAISFLGAEVNLITQIVTVAFSMSLVAYALSGEL